MGGIKEQLQDVIHQTNLPMFFGLFCYLFFYSVGFLIEAFFSVFSRVASFIENASDMYPRRCLELIFCLLGICILWNFMKIYFRVVKRPLM